MRKILVSVSLFLIIFQLHAQLDSATVIAPNGTAIHFYKFKPPHFNNTTTYPLIISLHGGGEAGDYQAELTNVLASGIPKLVANHATLEFTWNNIKEGFILLAPQATRANVPSWPIFYVDEMIKYALDPANNLRVDPARIFLQGYSYGGEGTWRYALSSATNAAKLAGIVPAAPTYAGPFTGAGFFDAGSSYCNVAQNKLAVWAFHGKGDNEGVTTSAVNAINACSGLVIPAVDSVYADGGHDIYNPRVYDTTNNTHYPNVYQWMLKVSRNLVPSTNQAPVPVIAGGSSITLTTPVKVKDFPLLDGSGSYDNDDIIMDYLWEATTTPSGSTITLARTQWPVASVSAGAGVLGMPKGNYNFRLRVKDYLTSAVYGSNNHTQFANLSVNIIYPNNGAYSAPVTDAGESVTIPSTQSQVLQKIGNAQSYPCTDCDVVSYLWTQLSGPPATLSNYHDASQPYPIGESAISFTNLNMPGVYKFQFAATTRHGETGTDVLTITKLNGTLPVSYEFFNGQRTAGANLLSWATSAEINSARFDVLRSADGTTFNTIGSVGSRGGQGTTQYSFEDNNPPYGVSYYRLSQVDKDGHSALSKTITINNRKTGLYVEQYPNPVHDNLTVTVQGSSNGTLQVVIADMQGKTLVRQQWQKDLSVLKKTINVGALQQGVYQMIVTVGQEKHVSSFVKY